MDKKGVAHSDDDRRQAGVLSRVVLWLQPYAIESVLLGLASALLVSLLVAVAGRIGFPYCLEWMEGAMVDNVERVLDGKRLFTPPSLEFVPYIYPPVYYWFSAAIAWVVGLGYLPLRIVSVLATVGTLACIVLFARREGGRWVAAVAAAALFAGTFPLSGAYFDVGRVDSLSVCLVLWSLWLVRFGRGTWSSLGASLLLTLAVFTKQSMLAMAFPAAVYLWWVDRRRACWFSGSLLVLVVGANVLLDRVHDGWYWYYTYSVVNGHQKLWDIFLPIVQNEVVVPLGLALAVSVWACLARSSLISAPVRVFYALQLACLMAIAVMGRVHSGGNVNVLMPYHAGLAVTFGVGLQALLAKDRGVDRRFQRLAALMAVTQLVGLLWDPRRTLPTEADKKAGDAWVEKIRAVPGPVWATHRGHMPVMAGKERQAHMMAILDVMRSTADFKGAKAQLVAEVEGAFSSKYFDLVILDNFNFWFLPQLQRHYQRDGVVWFQKKDVFIPRVGSKVRPEHGFVRKPNKTP